MAKTCVFSIRIPLDLKSDLDRVTHITQTPRNQVINDALNYYLSEVFPDLEELVELNRLKKRPRILKYK